LRIHNDIQVIKVLIDINMRRHFDIQVSKVLIDINMSQSGMSNV